MKSHKEFCNYMRDMLDAFEKNVDNLKEKNPKIHDQKVTFIQWFNYFKEWMEIGTYMHSEFYPYGTPSDYEDWKNKKK